MTFSFKHLLLATALVGGSLAANAVPAKPGLWRTITLADGTQVRAELRGDEYCSFYADKQGRTFRLSDDGKNYVQIELKDELVKADALRARANADRMKRVNARKSAARIGEANGSYFGKKKGIIILVNFKNKKFMFSHNQKFYNKVANERNYTSSLGHVGSVKDYFLAQSNGQFELDFDVVGPYTLSQNYEYYGAPKGDSHDTYPYKMIQEACTQADKDVNFADYDWDGDGYVDQVYVLFAGLGEAAGGDENTIWPHESQLKYYDGSFKTSAKTADGSHVYVNTYACGPENTVVQTATGALKTRVDGIGTLCHEFSHCLGYPDLYDTAYSGNMGMSSWDLMCSGSYNADGMCPPNYTAYEKIFAGWMKPTTLDRAATVKNLPAQDVNYGYAYIIYNDAHTDEYYLLENRQNNVGVWDRGLAGSGLQITHVDYDANIWSYNRVNTPADYSNLKNDHERLTIFCADNDRVGSSNTTDGSNTDAGDLYPYKGNNSLTDTSVPAAKIYNGGEFMGKPITNITQNTDGTIAFDFMGGSTENVIITGINGVAVDSQPATDNRVYSIDGTYLGTDINAVGHGVFVQNGKKIVK